MDKNDKENILEFKPRVKSISNLNDKSIVTKDKLRKEVVAPTKLVEFVLKCNQNDLWISIESSAINSLVNSSLTKKLKDGRAWELCNKTCSDIDSIVDIKKNKISIMNSIKSLKLEDKMLRLISLGVRHCTDYDIYGNNINTYLEFMIMIEDGVNYLANNSEHSKLTEYIQENTHELEELGDILFNTIEICYEECIKSNDFN